jgi:hypothetical protein
VTIPDQALDSFRKNPPASADDLDLRKYLIETGQWHYQMLRDGDPIGYVQAQQTTPTSHVVRGISETGEAAAIERAVVSIDSAGNTDNFEAVLLDLPQVAVAALTLLDTRRERGSRVCIFRAPSDQGAMPMQALIGASEFVRIVLSLRRIEGVDFGNPENEGER